MKDSSKCTDESFKIAAASAAMSTAGNLAGNFGPYGMAAKAGLDFINTLMNVIKAAVTKQKKDKLELDKNFPGIACAYYYAQKAKKETGLCEHLNSRPTEDALKLAHDNFDAAVKTCDASIKVKELDPGIKDLLAALKDVEAKRSVAGFKDETDENMGGTFFDAKDKPKNSLTMPSSSVVADQAEEFRASLNKLNSVFNFKDAAQKVTTGTYYEGSAGMIQKKDALEFQSILSQADKGLATINGVYKSVVQFSFCKCPN